MIIIFNIVRTIAFGFGFGIALKTGWDFNPTDIDPNIFFPKPLEPANTPNTVEVTLNHNYNTGLIITATILGASFVMTIITQRVTQAFSWINGAFDSVFNATSSLFSSAYSKLKQYCFDLFKKEDLSTFDEFEGCDRATALTGILFGSFNLLHLNKTISIWQVVSDDGTLVGIWLIKNVLQNSENLFPYTMLFKNVKISDLQKEFAFWIFLHKMNLNQEQNYVDIEEIVIQPEIIQPEIIQPEIIQPYSQLRHIYNKNELFINQSTIEVLNYFN